MYFSFNNNRFKIMARRILLSRTYATDTRIIMKNIIHVKLESRY